MNGILLRLKIDPAAVQSPRGSNALQAVQTLFGISLKNGMVGIDFYTGSELQIKFVVHSKKISGGPSL